VFTVKCGGVTKLQLLLPGETGGSGHAHGQKRSTPTESIAGTGYTVTVNAVDTNWTW